MDTLEAVASRASIRAFLADPIPEEDIKAILTAGMQAPSAVNKRPYAFILIKEKTIWSKAAEEVDHTTPIMRQAPLCIAIIGDKAAMLTDFFMIEDAAAAIENMFLAATALGYGSLWNGIRIGGTNQLYFDKALGLPEDKEVLAILAFGKKAMENPRKNRYEESKIHHEKW
jgi:nitroreductase